MTPAEIANIKGKITRTLSRNVKIAPATALSILPVSLKALQGKLYEAFVLAGICENLVVSERCTLRLMQGRNPVLKQKGSPIDRSYPYFVVDKGTEPFGELFTDVYFSTLSFHRSRRPAPIMRGDYHELDIALVKPGTTGMPEPWSILLAAECKNTAIQKHIIREVLGFRRELSYVLEKDQPTQFSNWPAPTVVADPASVHMLFSTDALVTHYGQNCLQFGTIVKHLKP